jgi:hypothetical protein
MELIPASFRAGYSGANRLHPTGVHARAIAGARWGTREGNPQGEFCLLNRLAKPLNFQIGFCDIDGHINAVSAQHFD